MSIIDRVGRRHAEIMRADPVTLEEFGVLMAQGNNGFARSKSGVTVSANSAMGITAWYRGVHWIAETVASLPVHTYRRTLGLGRDRRANPPWLSRPSEQIPWFSLIEFVMMSLLHQGNAFLFRVRNPSSQVVGLLPVHPDNVKYGVANGHKMFSVKTADAEWTPMTSFEILHIPALSMDGYFGIDPIRALANSLGTVAAGDQFAAGFYDGTHLGAYISMPGKLEDGDAERLRVEWDRIHKGLGAAHEFGVIGDGASYNTIGLDAEQTQILGARQFGVTEVARMLGVVPHKLYDLSRATFSNIEQQSIEAVTDGIRPWVARIEAFINFDRAMILENNFIEFELDGLLRGDLKSRYEAYAIATGGPWMEANVPRRLENMPPRDELDTVLRPLNMEATDDDPDDALSPQDFALMVQKLYLGVGPLISSKEAREVIGLEGDAPA